MGDETRDEPTAEAQDDDARETMMPSAKKRQHKKFFTATEQKDHFEQDLRDFIRDQLIISQSKASEAFTSTAQLKDAFNRLRSSKGKEVVSEKLLEKKFKQELGTHYARLQTACSHLHGYEGVVLKDN